MVADDPSARIVRIASPMASPGQCGICGKAQHDDGFAHADLNFEFYGTLIFCRDCAGSIAAVFGYVAPEDLEQERAFTSELQDELDYNRAKIKNLETALDALTALRPAPISVSRSFDPAPELPLVYTGDGSNVGSSEGTVEPDARVPAQGSSDAEGDVSEQGRNDVRDSIAAADSLLGL